MQINVAKREISVKIVYYGPGLSGKTTNLEVVHKKAPKASAGDLTSIATEGERTLFFDFMPVDLGQVGGLKTRLQLYTVPGQRYYGATRRLVLAGVDGVVFVADSQEEKLEENLESLRDLEENLRLQGLELEGMPVVFQWNKRDMPTAIAVDELEAKLNRYHSPSIEAVAVSGDGVLSTLKKIAQITLEKLNKTVAPTPNGPWQRPSTAAPKVEKAVAKKVEPPRAPIAPSAPAAFAPAKRKAPAPNPPAVEPPKPVEPRAAPRPKEIAPAPEPVPVEPRVEERAPLEPPVEPEPVEPEPVEPALVEPAPVEPADFVPPPFPADRREPDVTPVTIPPAARRSSGSTILWVVILALGAVLLAYAWDVGGVQRLVAGWLGR